MNATTKLSSVYAAGSLGGVANAFTVWFFGHAHITHACGVAIAPAFTPIFLFTKVIWGGIWGLIFILPVLKSRPFWRGILLALFPALVQLIYVFPYKTSAGMFGLNLGKLTPVFIVFFYMVWGVVASIWDRMTR